MEKEMKIIPPEGYEIDKENSTLDCIKFKLIQKKRFIDDEKAVIKGYWINNASYICDTTDCTNPVYNNEHNYNLFATKKQAKSALAMARISQIMANDERFGGVINDEEWKNSTINKYVIYRYGNGVMRGSLYTCYKLLAFHTEEQRDLFLIENKQLVKDYLMIN